MNKLRCLIIFSAMAVSAPIGQFAGAASPRERPSIVVEIQKGRPIYWVNGKIAKDPLDSIGRLWSPSLRVSSIDIMVDAHASFLQMGQAQGLASKAGFQEINIFVFDIESGLRERLLLKSAGRYNFKKSRK